MVASLGLALCLLASSTPPRTPFWAPRVPPRAQYSVEVTYSPSTQQLQGVEIIKLTNTTNAPIGRLALRWHGTFGRVQANGAPVRRVAGPTVWPLFELPEDLAPGQALELHVEFSVGWKLSDRTNSAISSYIGPVVWWGFGTHADYDASVHVPEGYAFAVSGRLDPATGTYRATNVRAFGLFLGRGYETLEADAGGTRVRAVFTPAGRACAELLVKTAVDAITFYRARFGFYPHPFLSIVPGAEQPMGGYPAASGLVVIHGQERIAGRTPTSWAWITAHEIGHQYWSEHVLAEGSDPLSWLMIGLGIHADRELRRARGIKDAGQLERNYVQGVAQGLDTTVDVTEEMQAAVKWDFNNVVQHGKSAAMLNALEATVGRDAFDAAYRRCLREYAGRQLGWRAFQAVVEEESRQDLGWFFEQWVRSPASPNYRVAARDCVGADRGFVCTVRVERSGALRMPVTIAARFADGTEQRARTERLADVDELTFRAASPIADVVLEPDEGVLFAAAPSDAERRITERVKQLPWTGAGEAALTLYREAQPIAIRDAGTLLKLGQTLYDGRHYDEALEMFNRLAGQADSDAIRFDALVWQGHVLDLLGRRADAISRYEASLKIEGSPKMRHDQYGLVIDKAWAQERLTSPFERK